MVSVAPSVSPPFSLLLEAPDCEEDDDEDFFTLGAFASASFVVVGAAAAVGSVLSPSPALPSASFGDLSLCSAASASALVVGAPSVSPPFSLLTDAPDCEEEADVLPCSF